MWTRIWALIQRNEKAYSFLPCPPSCEPPESCERPDIDAYIADVPEKSYTNKQTLWVTLIQVSSNCQTFKN